MKNIRIITTRKEETMTRNLCIVAALAALSLSLAAAASEVPCGHADFVPMPERPMDFRAGGTERAEFLVASIEGSVQFPDRSKGATK